MQELIYGSYAVLMLLLAGVATTTLVLMLHAWRTPEVLDGTHHHAADSPASGSFSLLVPARHEQNVLESTLIGLTRLEHPMYEVLVIIGHDDPETQAVADDVAARHPGLVRVVIDESVPKNKPKALNTALPHCRGRYIGVFDAEDDVHPDLLRRISAVFADTGADAVQGGVQLMNFDSSWYALRNVLEYFFWFKSRLHYQASKSFIPLGGNTVFLRADVLREAGGWDQECLAEDCELGVRLSIAGKTTVVMYDPGIATREETPDSLRALVKQRTRWNQGFLQVLAKPHWRRLPPGQRLLAGFTLAMPFVQALAGVLLPLAFLTMAFGEAPVLLSMITFVPIMPALAVLGAEIAGLRAFGNEFGLRVGPRDYVRLVAGALPYQVVLSYAALRAVWRQQRGRRDWEKTEHAGVHLRTRADAVVS